MEIGRLFLPPAGPSPLSGRPGAGPRRAQLCAPPGRRGHTHRVRPQEERMAGLKIRPGGWICCVIHRQQKTLFSFLFFLCVSWYKHAWGKLILWATGITVRTANTSFSPALLSFKLLAVPTPCAVHTTCFPDFLSLAVISHLYSIQNPGFLHFVPRPRLRRPPPLLRHRAPLHTQAPRLREAGNGEAGDLTNHLF